MAKAYQRSTSMQWTTKNRSGEVPDYMEMIKGQFHQNLASIVVMNLHKRRKLSAVCEIIHKKMLSGASVEQEINEQLPSDLRENWLDRLIQIPHELDESTTSVLVIGDVGAGKSSLINLLLRHDLLPVGARKAARSYTKMLCTIMNGRKTRLVVTRGENIVADEDLDLDLDDGYHWESSLLSQASGEERTAKLTASLPFLGNYLRIVDTPGIDENSMELLAPRLVRDTAVIVVLSRETSLSRRHPVGKFLSTLRDMIDNHRMKKLDTLCGTQLISPPDEANILFVFTGGEGKFEPGNHVCLENLRQVWPSIRPGNVLFLSITEAANSLQQQGNRSEDLKEFERVFCDIIAKCLYSQLLTTYNWIERLATSFLEITRAKYNFAKKAISEKAIEESLLRERLWKARRTSERRMKELDDLIAQICLCIRVELMNYLRSPEILDRMSNFETGRNGRRMSCDPGKLTEAIGRKNAVADEVKTSLNIKDQLNAREIEKQATTDDWVYVDDKKDRRRASDIFLQNHDPDTDDSSTDDELPDGEDFETIGARLLLLFFRRIDAEINRWNEKHAVEMNGDFDPLKTRFALEHAKIRELSLTVLREIEEEAMALSDLLAGDKLPLMVASHNELSRSQSDFIRDLERAFEGLKPVTFVKLVLDGEASRIAHEQVEGVTAKRHMLLHRVTSLTRAEKVVFGATAIVWMPLALVGGALSLPVIATIMAKDKVNNQKKVRNYRSNKNAVARSWMKNFVRHTFDASLLDELLSEALLKKIHEIQTAVKKHIAELLEKIEARLAALTNDNRSLRCIRRVYDPVLNKVELMLNHIYACHARYLRDFEFAREDFEHLREVAINVGSFGDIYRTSCCKTSREVAVKVIKDKVSEKNAFDIYMEEAAWLKLCSGKNPHILDLLGMLYLEKENRIGFVMELCDGTLKHLIEEDRLFVPYKNKQHSGKLSAFNQIIDIALQLTNALSYVHSNNLIHRDLKLENVLYVRQEKKIIIKLCDFGLSKSGIEVTTTIAGTMLYMAPEVLKKLGCSQASDVYSLGLVLWEMYHGQPVFKAQTDRLTSFEQVERAISRGDFHLIYPDPSIPPVFRHLTDKCSDFNPETRPTVHQIHDILNTIQTQPESIFRPLR